MDLSKLSHAELIALSTKMLQENQQLTTEKQQLASEKQQLASENDMLQKTLMLQKTTTISSVSVYNNFLDGAERVTTVDAFGWAVIDNETLKRCWQTASTLRMDGDETNEQKHVHPYVEKLLKTIFSCLGSEKNVTVHHEVVMSQAQIRLDHVITEAHITKPSFYTIIAIIEENVARITSKKRTESGSESVILMKAPYSKEGAGQACSYLSTQLLALADIASEQKLIPVAIYTNGEEIAFFQYKNGDASKRQITDFLRVSNPFGDLNNQTIPLGFTLLCSFLKSILEVAKVQMLCVNAISYVITSIIIDNPVRTVAIVRDMRTSEEFVMKFQKHREYENGRINRERVAYEILYNMNLDLNLLAVANDRSDFKHILLSPVGLTFTDYVFPLICVQDEKINDSDAAICAIITKAITELEKLHNAGFCHVDVRPQNILIVQDQVYLIDFETMIRNGTEPSIDSRSFYSSEPFLLENYGFCFKYNPIDDLEAFAYSVLFTFNRPPKFNSIDEMISSRNAVLNSSKYCKFTSYMKTLQMLDIIRQTRCSGLNLNYDQYRGLFI